MKVLKVIGKGLSFIGVFLLVVIVTLYSSLLLICYGPSTKARNLFVTTFLETGALKFMVKLVMTDAKVQEVVDSNSLKEMDSEVDTDLINVNSENKDIETVEISGSNYKATLLIVHDPSKIKVATTYPFGEYGKDLETIVKENDAIGGINGGIYVSTGNKGGYPMGLVVQDGKIVWNDNGVGYHLIG